MTGSPAVGKGILTGAPVSDERGSPSVTNGKINVGAISLVPMASASITGKMIQATEGQLFQGQVATLQVSGAGANDTFTATIDWGDQSVPNAGTFTGSNGSYTINGSHTYADEGPYTIIIKAARTASPTSVIASGTSMASVAEGDKLSGKVTPGLTAAGLQFSGTVATFTDSDTASPATDFMATISWGDKTTSPGTVSASNGSFTVAGSHSYSGTGSLPIGVTLTEKTPGSATTTANGSLAVTSSSPRETIGDVLDSLTALKATATGDNAHRLARAIHKLTAALGSSLWINDSHLSPEDGETVFDRVKDATQRLFELYKDEHSNLPKDALLSNLMKLAQATEELASIAIMEASAEDENEHELDEAKNELARGISAWNAGQFDSVIDHFKNAWQDAEHVLRD